MMTWPQRWNEFWYRPSSDAAIAVLRVLFGLMLAYDLASHTATVAFWNLIDGAIPRASVLSFFPGAAVATVYALAATKTVLYLLLGLHGVAVAAFIVGYRTRIAAALVYIFTISMMNYTPLLLFGFDQYVAIFALVFLVNPGASYLSLDARAGRVPRVPSVSATVATRMFQVAFVFRYFDSGFHKVAEGWKSGDLLWQILTNDVFARFDLTFTHRLWSFYGVMSLVTVLFEIFFAPLVAWPATRRATIAVGLYLHASIAIFMNLTAFGLVMMLGYVLFIAPETWSRVLRRLRLSA